MIQKIILDNFQAHKHTELVLGPGVTVLTGPNNSGKSAIVEAIRCVATNPTPRNFIRHNAKQARVEIIMDDGTSVAWCRKKNTAWYELKEADTPVEAEPEYFRKLGRGMVPDAVRQALRLDLVELEKRKSVDVHIGNQKTPIFLLEGDAADAKLAEFFASSSESAHLLAMQKSLQSRNREAKGEVRVLGERMVSIAEELNQLEALPALALKAEAARTLAESVSQCERDIPALERQVGELQRLHAGVRHSHERATCLAPLTAPPVLFDEVTLSQSIANLTTLDRAKRLAQGRSAATTKLLPLPDLYPTVYLENYLEHEKRLESRREQALKRQSAMSHLQPTPEIHNEQPLAGLLSDINMLSQHLQKAHKGVQAHVERLATMKRQIDERLAQIGTCPLCGGDLEASAFTGSDGPSNEGGQA